MRGRRGGEDAPGRGGPPMEEGRAVPAGQGGFTLVELIVALALIAVVAVGFTVSVGLGFRTIAVAKQRTTASEIASARLEHVRNVPYDLVALSSQPTHNADPTHPDHGVSADGTTYDVTGNGDDETLIVDTANGLVLHLEDPVQIGSTVMEIYQYVTWVDDPSIGGTEDYKRVTVVVRYKTPASTGISTTLRVSTLVTRGTITFPSGTTTTTESTTTTTTSSTTTTTTVAECSGDTTAPTGGFTIGASGDAEVGFTASTNVTLNLSFTDDCTPIVANFSNDNVTFGEDVVYDPLNQNVSWALTGGDGTKTVYGKVRDGAGNETALSSQSVVLDTTAPSVPGTLIASISCSGVDRSVTLSWAASSDDNLRGYRVYRSTDNATWTVLITTSGTSASDTHKKNLDTVRYYVAAYDKAGNESDPTNTVSLAKNQCS